LFLLTYSHKKIPWKIFDNMLSSKSITQVLLHPMSGHSKWHKIKRAKEAGDKKKSQLFTKLTREIHSALRQGSDPAANVALREAIARAHKANMPQANIDRLLIGGKHQATRREVTYEAFGPGGVACLVKASTDNPKRVVSQVRSIFSKYGGNLGGPNSVRWKFAANMKPIYTMALSSADRKTLVALIEELNNSPDITHIYTDSDE
jgi:YebC/PmpR family DNA-binding regulatory protein